MKRLSLIIGLAMLMGGSSLAQEEKKNSNLFNNITVGLTAGTTGFGFDVATPVTEFAQLRVGATFMPHFTKTMHFSVQVGVDDPNMTPEQNQEIQNNRFNKLADLLEGFVGYRVSNKIDMLGEPTMNQAKVMVDIFPFKENKHWHVTAGFFIGNEKVAKSYNPTEAMTSLLAVSMYNSMYWNVMNEQPFITYNGMGVEFPPQINQKFMEYGTMAVKVGEFKEDFYATQDMYYDHDVYDLEGLTGWNDDGSYKKLHSKGDVEYHKGDLVYHKGDSYRMVPGKDNMMRATAKVNMFRPYVGIGYDGYITKDKKTSIGANLGVMFWGGTPKIITHDGVDMMHDLVNVNGQVKHYLDIMRNFPVFPVLNLRVARTIF